MMSYSIFKTLFGWMAVVEGEQGLKRIYLPQVRRSDVKKNILREFSEVKEHNTRLKPYADALAEYFKGKSIAVKFHLDWSDSAEFLVTVWKGAQDIPPGEVRSYQWLSAHIKKPGSFRAASEKDCVGKIDSGRVIPGR